MKRIFILCFLLLAVALVSAEEEERQFTLKHTIGCWDNQNFSFCYSSGDMVYNLRSVELCQVGKVRHLQISPARFAFAVLYEKGNKNNIAIFSMLNRRCLHDFNFNTRNSAVDFCFSADARNIVVLGANQVLTIYNLKNYKAQKSIILGFLPENLTMSSNNYFIAFSYGDKVYIYNYETGAIRTYITVGEKVNSISFSTDNSRMAVLTGGGKMIVYDTRSFNEQMVIEDLGDARECVFHPDEKYVSVITSQSLISIINLKDTAKNYEIDMENQGISHIGYAKSLKGVNYLVFNANTMIYFHPVDNLRPNYHKMVTDSVDIKMKSWMKRQRGESLDEYHTRVSEETRQQKYQEYENEVATRLAGDLVDSAKVSYGKYTEKDTLLEIKFDILPPIYIKVEMGEVTMFSEDGQLIFENTVYSVDEKDNFELLYTEVINQANGKRYVFNNLQRQDLHNLADDENFVPLEIIQQSSMDELRLEELKNDILSQAMDSNLISGNTHINVKTNVEASVNADGKKILNYIIDFDYNVEQEFSFQDDYKKGQYVCSQSEAAMAMLRIVKQAFDQQFASYLAAGKKVLIAFYGSADATPVNRVIPYNGEYGEFEDEIIYNQGELGVITVTRGSGITSNEQLSFIRAAGVHDYVVNNITQLQQMVTDYTYHISVSQESGSEFRRIGVKFTFVDAFGN